MSTLLQIALVAIPVFVQVLLAAFTYYDAQQVGMDNPKRWTAIVLFIPVYGLIVYLLTRSELDYDPETDPYKGGKINVHPSRADDIPWESRKPDAQPGVVPREEASAEGRETEDGDREWDASDEWNDPSGVDLEDERER